MLKHLVTGVAAVCIFLAALAACRPFEPQQRPSPADSLDRQFSLYTGTTNPLTRWWLSFDDPNLNRLIERALDENLTLKAAWARLKQARALSIQAGADRYPDLTGTAAARAGRQQSGNSASKGIDLFSLGIASTYEIDLWGRVDATYRSAILNTEASREDLNTVAMTLAAEITNRWIGVIALRMQKKLLQEQLRNNQILLELIDLRFQKAMVSALDVYQQKQVVENIKAEIPLVEAEEILLLHEIAVLLGKPPRTEMNIRRTDFPLPPTLPPTGLPADLLSARPDVRTAGLQLQAADWQIAAARANRLPAISLTAQAHYGESNVDDLFDNWLASLAANLSAPLLDGGRRAADVDRARSVADEKLAMYQQTVLTAVKEVEDALISEVKTKEHIDGLLLVMASARRALEEAGVRYRNGLNDYLPVLTQLTTVQGLERDLIRQRADLLNIRVSLHRALGGTWAQELTPPEMSADTNKEIQPDKPPEG